MTPSRTPLLLSVLEQAPVPVDWPKRIGYPPPGIMRKTAYPAGGGDSAKGAGFDDKYPCTKEGKKIARSHAWMFPSKRIKVCGKTLKV